MRVKKNLWLKVVLLLIVTLGIERSVNAQITWNFTSNAVTSGTVPNITAGNVSQGNNNGSTTFIGAGSPASTGYSGASAGNNGSISAKTGAINTGTSSYIQTTLTAASGYSVKISNISWGNYSVSTSGPTTLSVYSSADNYAAPIGTVSVVQNSTWTLLSPAINVVTGNSGQAVTLRIYASGGSGSTPAAGTGNWRIDDMKITAVALPVVETISINMKNSASTAASTPWNNITSVNTTGLKNNAENITGVGLEFLSAPWNTGTEGNVTGNNSGVYPDDVIRDYFWFGNYGAPEAVNMAIKGLEAAGKYNIQIFGSSKWNGVSDNGTTIYAIDGIQKPLYVHQNTQNIVTFNGIKPNLAGNIIINMSKGAFTSYGLVTALVVEKLYDADDVIKSWEYNGNTIGAVKKLGTVDSFDLPVITNNIERLRVTATGNIGIGTTIADSVLHIVGGLKLVNGTQGVGKVLTSDSTGGASWQNAVGSSSIPPLDSVLAQNNTGLHDLIIVGNNNRHIGLLSDVTNSFGRFRAQLGDVKIELKTSLGDLTIIEGGTGGSLIFPGGSGYLAKSVNGSSSANDGNIYVNLQSVASQDNLLEGGIAFYENAYGVASRPTTLTQRPHTGNFYMQYLPIANEITLTASVNSKTADDNGAIVLNKNDIGLGSVNNTSDLDKPISTATQIALDEKQDELISGTNIKTINGNSLLGSGNLTINTIPTFTNRSVPYANTSGVLIEDNTGLSYNGNDLSVGHSNFNSTTGISINGGRGYFGASGFGMTVKTNGGVPADESKSIAFFNSTKRYLKLYMKSDSTLNMESDVTIYPTITNARSLGNYTNQWLNTYTQNLFVNGTLKFNIASVASGYVLTSDATGNATWQAPSGGGGSSQWTSSGINTYHTNLNGKVLIGMTSVTDTNFRLYVDKGIRTRKVKVDQANWPDYVFEKDYQLPSLKYVEEFIAQNKHLPDMPSANEIEKNGADLGEIQSALLKKIEELTLYTIEQEKKAAQQQQQINDLEKKLDEIKAWIKKEQ